MADLVELRGIQVLARCGATEAERLRFQPIEIDLDIEADQTLAGSTDDLNDAIDYEQICDAVSNLAETKQFSLIEKMSQTIVNLLFETDSRIDAVRISLRKMHPPVQMNIKTAGVSFTRKRK